MVHIDLNAPDASLEPGVDAWTIVKAEVTKSRAGQQMLKLQLSRMGGQGTVYDNLMLEGGGFAISKRKLTCLLGEGFKGELDPLDLVGRQVWLETDIRSYNGRDTLSVNIDGLKFAGYQDINEPPVGKTVPVAPEPVSDDVPF